MQRTNQDGYGDLLDRVDYKINTPTESVHYPNARLHMLRDSPNLVTQIEQLTEDVKKHNQSVKEFRSLVNDTIHNAFRKPTLPTVSEYYNYNFSNLYDILIGIWNSIITGDNDDLMIIQNKMRRSFTLMRVVIY
jgi:hypothetical protein